MKIIVAPDSFKGSLTAVQAADSIEKGIRTVFPDAQVVKIPVADGGEGTVNAICSAVGGKLVSIDTYGPLGDTVTAEYEMINGDTAVIEVASSAGITLIDENKRNPLKTTTFGVGHQIVDAVENGAKAVIIGLGGSATNDGGTGAAQAMGAGFYDTYGNKIERCCGETLAEIAKVDMTNVSEKLKSVKFIFACDVKNPLLGKDGCAAVFAPQKGADDECVALLEKGMSNYRDVVLRDFKFDIDFESAGAAGGFLASFAAMFDIEIKSGIETVLNLCDFDSAVCGADFVITGEGKIDGQSVFGKVPVGVAARSRGLPVYVIAGSMGKGAEKVYDCGITSIMPITNGVMTLEHAMSNAQELVENAAERLCRIIKKQGEKSYS